MGAERLSVDPAALKRVPLSTCRKYTVVPLEVRDRTLTLAMADPSNVSALDDVCFMTGLQVEPVAASKESILAAITEAGGADEVAQPPAEDLEPDDASGPAAFEPAPIAAIINTILRDAIRQQASHVHIEPTASDLRISFRIDGVLREVRRVPGMLASPVTSRLKILAKLDIAEKRLPQDGRIRIKIEEEQHDVGIATMPILFGERFTLVFSTALRPIAMAQLGFPADVLAGLARAADTVSGLVLVAGPSRSGRRTTLYAILEHLNDGTRAIFTVEDPVRRSFAGISQSQVRSNIGYTAAAVLRTILRHDADVIMISRIEDAETGQAAIEAAGNQQVLASVGADGAPAALLALVRLGCPATRLAGVARLVLAQRLVRRICDDCRIEDSRPDEGLGLEAGIPANAVFCRGAGCSACGRTGYRGRLPISEMLTCSGAVRDAIFEGAGEPDVRAAAIAAGMRPFVKSALDAALAGRTTLDECWRVKAELESA